jgi:hypothetical protein
MAKVDVRCTMCADDLTRIRCAFTPSGECATMTLTGLFARCLETETVPQRLACVLVALIAIGGCASENLIVPLQPEIYAPRDADLARKAIVEVTDIRLEADLETGGLGVYIGKITLEPSEVDLVRELVEARADTLLANWPVTQAPPTIQCGIREFEIVTPATVLYFDVTARIELVIRVDGEDRTAAGQGIKRTYVWPRQKIVEAATNEALSQLIPELDLVLAELLVKSPE